MLTASAATINILLTSPVIFTADLYKITLPNGTTIRWSGGDRPFTIGPNTYEMGPLITRTKTKRKVGLDVDVMTLNVMDNGGITIGGRPMLRTMHEGEFDGALVEVDRLFLSSWDDLTPGVVPWFIGYVSDANTEQGKTELRVKSMLGYLDVPMPLNVYMPSCNNTFGNLACGKDKIALTGTGTVAASSTAKSINLAGAAIIKPDDYYTLGVAKITSGPNAGLTRTVRKQTGANIQVSPEFPTAPGTGDTIAIYPSCFKTRAACIAYTNEAKFRGFPYVPAPDTMYSGSTSTPPTSPVGGTGSPPIGTGPGGRRNQATYIQ